MRNLLNPKWFFLINTLPIVLLYFFSFSQFSLIKSLLDENTKQLWLSFALVLGFMNLAGTAYVAYLITKKQIISAAYYIIMLVSYIVFIYVYLYNSNDFIPSTIPRWMMEGNILIYVGTFLMPTIAYSLFALVVIHTPENKEHKPSFNFIIALGVPIGGFLFSQLILPLWHNIEGQFLKHTLAVLTITATLVFLFFLVRGFFIIATKKAAFLQKIELFWKIPVVILFPIMGLLLNNGKIEGMFRGGTGVFGDFNNEWFYILAVLNGVLLCLPNLENKLYRLFLYVGRVITFAYTLYFFIVFLPFLPLSIIAIIVYGAGFLMLTPLVLFVIHTSTLSKDFVYLSALFSKKILVLALFLGFMTIPVLITSLYLKDRNILSETLDYLYSPNYAKEYNIDKKSLQTTLNTVKYQKGNNDFIFGTGIPYLSSYFNWLVLDNLTLSDTKINYISKIFLGNQLIKMRSQNTENDSNNNVNISNIKGNSVYDASQKVWKSWIDIELTNKNTNFAEYSTKIDLPVGCWISDYYLYVGDRKEFGILAEKKAAMWVYSQIRNTNRDPGILYYLKGNKVAFNVFPFANNEIRKTGIEFLHKEPIKITIDTNVIELGKIEKTENITAQNIENERIETENVIYVSAKQKTALKPVLRKPYFHFLVDISQNQDKKTAFFINKINKVLENNKLLVENAKISFVNSFENSIENTISVKENWQQKYQSRRFEGGFYLERAIKTTLFNAHKNRNKTGAYAGTYPVIMVVTDNIQKAILDDNFSDFAFAFPESDVFYSLIGNDTTHIQTHSLLSSLNLLENTVSSVSDKFIVDKNMLNKPVLAYKLADNSVAYLANDNQASIILKKDVFQISEGEIKEKNWLSALTMQAQWTSQILHPETSDKEWLNLVKNSFISKVMTPVTSYLVVENDAQKAILKKKQEQVLSSKKALDLGEEDAQRMSEPSLIIVAILLLFVLWLKERRKKKLV